MRIDRAFRVVAAPCERVFQAFIKPDQIVRWLPPAGARAILDEFEPTPDGRFRMTLVFGGGGSEKGKTSENTDTVDGKFLEVVPPHHIVQQFTFVSDNPSFAGTMRMTWTLAERTEGTLVGVAAENVPEGISPEAHQVGMASSLENLATYVEN